MFNEFFLNEKAVSLDDVISNEPDTAAIKVDFVKFNKEYLKIILYNFKTNLVEGLIILERFKGDKEYMIAISYAIDKHGPLMYDLALSVTSPSGIIPDRTIRPAAQKIWSYFTENRPDVKKTPMTKKDYWFATEYELDIEHQHLNTPEIISLLNTVYSVTKPFVHVDELFKKGDELMTENKLNPKDIAKQAEEDFRHVYDKEFEK